MKKILIFTIIVIAIMAASCTTVYDVRHTTKNGNLTTYSRSYHKAANGKNYHYNKYKKSNFYFYIKY